ncbi:hypothetical protein ES703_123518 [subsurface metagenome]
MEINDIEMTHLGSDNISPNSREILKCEYTTQNLLSHNTEASRLFHKGIPL